MGVKVAINGFGRIGRMVMRSAFKNGSDLEFVAVNDLVDPKSLAYLFKYDSVYGVYPGEVKADDNSITIDGKKIKVTGIKNPAELPHKDMGVDLVVESTGLFRKKADAQKHIDAGAKKVLISAPPKDEVDGNFVLGVNDEGYDKKNHNIISIGSCTTNGLAPIVKVLNDNFEIEHAFMTTIHSYTSSQNIVDGPHKDLRRARAAAVNMLPTTTGAAKAISKIIPEVEGKIDGMAIRVPTPCGSLIDLAAVVKKDATAESINEAFKKAASAAPLKGILKYETDPIVLTDIIGNNHSTIFDSEQTRVIGKTLVKLYSWYDNEWGFSTRMWQMLEKML
ncbi:MAG: type I glyceraldehyde-3-phosphate dehydrogenase [candidate division Zixibacteria bacterium]|nr:type I glyceraldehyde-3-phosphate dehydrogenase [candidate division Zixibacteria bacterium]NIR67675.1 type I glyceraldehyde-3-phosphate dehydrogenase [candidate division Zixibacteria bacterium]NIS17892.1 type I glyceraldehyde-3-phosphate dehydrogenase [candidate division Zixibacteria bacterium]NIS47948.1 type I glyceraldehyde-3-phosphate dehydrogenase [candidate division Zixibacteria bacterium]NIT54173.1 type I glyceraldehyde-3-phosphate dehydrogenase [candidate division Zixibacteria bacteri